MARIAIAEPDPQVRQLFTEVVEELGHEPVALYPCDLIVVEPGWAAGRRMAEYLRAEQPDLPIVCTASGEADVWVEEHSAAFLRKPFPLDDLRRAITEALKPR